MIKRKRAFYLSIGFLSQIIPLIFLIIISFNCDCKNSTGASLAVFVLNIILFGLYNGFIALLTIPFRDNGKTVFAHFFLKSFKKMKIVSHEYLGDFFINLDDDENKIVIYSQKFFVLENIGTVYKSNDIEKMANSIKAFLDKKYQDILNEKNKKEATIAWKKRVEDWDGYLDTVTRRDNKINKLLKK